MSMHHTKKPSHRSVWDVLATGVLIGVFGGFVFVVGIFLITREYYTQITSIRVSGNTVIKTEDIQNAVRGVLSEDCFVHASCGYGLWLPVEYIAHSLVTQFPRLQNVVVRYVGDGTVSVRVTERSTAFRFCLDEYMNSCYLADRDAVLFEHAPTLSDLRTLPTVMPDTTKIRINTNEAQVPWRLWNTEELQQYHSLVRLLEPYARPYRIRYSRRDIVVEVDRLYNYALTNDTALLKFNRESLGNPERIMYMRASLDRLISFQPFAEVFKVYPQSLDYLDLRFPKRLYMKFADSESTELDTEKPKSE